MRKHLKHWRTTFLTIRRPDNIQNLSRRDASVCWGPECNNRRCSFLITKFVNGCDVGRTIGCFVSKGTGALINLPPTLIIPSSSRNGFNEAKRLSLGIGLPFERDFISLLKVVRCIILISIPSALLNSVAVGGLMFSRSSLLEFEFPLAFVVNPRQSAVIRSNFENDEYREKRPKNPRWLNA